MKAEYVDSRYIRGREFNGSQKTIDLPFKRVSARAIIIRKKDGCILATLHRKAGKFALPGGALEDGESTEQAVRRELAEENIKLIDAEWDPRVVVDYFEGYQELSVWHIALVEQAEIRPSRENVETRWLSQDEDLWYPSMREKILLALSQYTPDLCRATVELQVQ